MNSTTKRFAALAVGTVAVMGTGVAFAAWTSTGSGSGTALATHALNSTVAADASAADLYPGGTDTFTITVSNPNKYPVIVTSIPAASSAAIGSCAAGSVTSTARSDAAGLKQSNGTTVLIPANNGTTDGSGTYTIAGNMIANPDNSCQDASFTLAWSPTGGPSGTSNVVVLQSAAS